MEPHLHAVAVAVPSLAAEQTGGSALESLLPFALLAVAFYFLLIRPQRKRAHEAAQVRASLDVGAEVITTAGLYGTVALVEDDSVLLEVAPGVTNRYAKGAIARVLNAGPGAADDLDGRDDLDERDLDGDPRGDADRDHRLLGGGADGGDEPGPADGRDAPPSR